MSADHADRHARQDRRNEARLRAVPQWPAGPLGDALHTLSVRWTAMHAGSDSPIVWDRERIASRVFTLAHHVSFEDAEQRAEMWLEIAALGLVGLVNASLDADVAPASGDAA